MAFCHGNVIHLSVFNLCFIRGQRISYVAFDVFRGYLYTMRRHKKCNRAKRRHACGPHTGTWHMPSPCDSCTLGDNDNLGLKPKAIAWRSSGTKNREFSYASFQSILAFTPYDPIFSIPYRHLSWPDADRLVAACHGHGLYHRL